MVLSQERLLWKTWRSLRQQSFILGRAVGCNDRKLKHLQEALLVFNGEMKLSRVSAKLTKISKSWENASGVAVIQLFSDADHYVSLCRENAMIKSCKNLTNMINGSIYGLMKDKWSVFEIKNFGEMLLYFALKQCIVERPSIIFPKDVKKKKPVDVYEPKKYCIRSKYELKEFWTVFLTWFNHLLILLSNNTLCWKSSYEHFPVLVIFLL